ncbi:MAG TPA: prepilin peptidase, partial [Candidatus Aphodocola excrementigallinarum]|nr:prepilin peptidase [Candidatus Aphodocola excrementigallinarum]
MNIEIFNCIMIFIIGLIFGSFYNVVGYRLPNNMSIVFPASHCPKCNHKLKFYELIPVFSYMFLKGKCKACK